jgi:hypothetical protein
MSHFEFSLNELLPFPVQRDKYYNSQKNPFPVKKVIEKQHPAAEDVVVLQNLNTNVKAPLRSAAPTTKQQSTPLPQPPLPPAPTPTYETKATEEALAHWHRALSIQLDAAHKALLATTSLKTLMPVVVQDVQARPEQYINKATGNGIMSEYFTTVGQNYMNIALKCIATAKEFHNKGV